MKKNLLAGLALACAAAAPLAAHAARREPGRDHQRLGILGRGRDHPQGTRGTDPLIDVAATAEGTAQGDLVCVLQVGTDRQTSSVLGAPLPFDLTPLGVPADQRERLFEPFQQADSSTTRKYGGTGLGLAISKRCVEMMGGEIGVRSQPGKGSDFHFTLDFGLPMRVRRRQTCG